MFNNDSWKKYQQIVALKTKQIEEMLVAKTSIELSKNMNLDKNAWAAKRIARQRLLFQSYLAEMKKGAKDINKILNEAMKYALKTSTADLVQAVGLPEQKELITQTTNISLKVGIANVQNKVQSDLQMLFQQAVTDYRATIPRVQLDSRDLFRAISSAIEDKTDNGFVVYMDNRKVSFKSYMEMSVRTEMQQNALFNLEASSQAAGVNIFISSAHSDSADDHADFQGFYYLADGAVWKEEYEKYNFHPRYKYLSEVKALGFLTRPNCRHYIMPVTEDQLGQSRSVHKQLGMPNRKSNPAHYENLQEQRANERQIRKYASRVNNDKIILDNAPNSEIKSTLRRKMERDERLLATWKERQRVHVQKSYLKRQPIREKPGIIVNDLGVRKTLNN